MTVAFYMNCVSAHQLPLARETAKLVGEANFRYVDAGLTGQAYQTADAKESWIVKKPAAGEILENCDLLLTGLRDFDLIERRSAAGKKTCYYSERWFKPRIGILRLLAPRYFRMARRFVRLLSSGANCLYYPIGIHGARDMARLCGLMHGSWKCLFQAPELDFERKPGGRIHLAGKWRFEDEKRYCLDKMRMWGYYVAPPETNVPPQSSPNSSKKVRALWVGRLLNWKRVDTIVRAVGEIANEDTTLDIYGEGPAERRIRKLAARYGETVKFHPPVTIAEVRKLMREHDVYILSSNGYEGWGAVASEALEEGMKVLGTCEAGACATMLPEECRFHAGDWRALMKLLEAAIPHCGIGAWTAKTAASALTDLQRPASPVAASQQAW